MLDMGLTTFAENPEPTRSDCHAWSSSPLYDLLATVCGVEPASPGFKSVKIEPHFGHLHQIKGRIPHEKGFIDIDLKKKGTIIEGVISLPEGLSGKFIFDHKKLDLSSGTNSIQF